MKIKPLPLNKNAKIALIGPFVNNKSEMFSMWSFLGDINAVVTLFDGIKKQNQNIASTEGTLLSDDAKYLKRIHGTFDKDKQAQLVEEAIETGKKSDVIVLMLGEAQFMSGEARSFANISIPNCQKELLKALKATGKPVVLLLTNGRPLTIEDDMQYADAILETWRLGTEAGDAIADVLFGNYNPTGKLTMTFPRSVGQIPIYYNHKNTGRPYTPGKKEDFVSNYQDEDNSPLFPFGYGLSYTTFSYSDIQLSDTLLNGVTKPLNARIKITNTGKYAGEETAQLYLNDPVASVTRPVKELKKFRKLYLQPGESKEVSFSITTEDLKFYNSNLKWDWEPGKFNIYIGTNSENVKMSEFVWKK